LANVGLELFDLGSSRNDVTTWDRQGDVTTVKEWRHDLGSSRWRHDLGSSRNF